MPLTSADVVNRALELIGSQTQVSGTLPAFDNSTAGIAAGVVYQAAVQLLLRRLDPSFARRTAVLAAAGGTTPPPWAQEYAYPADCLRVRQVRPAAGSYNQDDPQPIRAAVMFDSGLAAKVIVSNAANALATYTSSAPTEAEWDDSFAESVSRLIANPLSMAIAGRPDFAKELLQEASDYAVSADFSDDL